MTKEAHVTLHMSVFQDFLYLNILFCAELLSLATLCLLITPDYISSLTVRVIIAQHLGKIAFRSKKGVIHGMPETLEKLGAEASSRKYCDDGSVQGKCQTLEVISCSTEDFYGILVEHLTSHIGGLTHILHSSQSSFPLTLRLETETEGQHINSVQHCVL